MEPNRTIIDTDILIDFLRNQKEAVAFVTQIEEKKTLLHTTAINAFELYYGAHKSRQSVQTLHSSRIDIDAENYFDWSLQFLWKNLRQECNETAS